MTNSYKQRIPKITAVVLALGGCSEPTTAKTTEEMAKTTEEAKAEAIDSYCRRFAQCDPAGFQEEFPDENACSTYYDDVLSEYATEYGDECGEAYADVLECYANATCDELLSEDSDLPCEALDERLDEVCSDEE